MPIPRSTIPGAVTKANGVMFSTPLSLGTLAPGTANITVNVPRKFRPGRFAQALFSGPLDAGLAYSNVTITGNVPNYQAVLAFVNETNAPITPVVTVTGIFTE